MINKHRKWTSLIVQSLFEKKGLNIVTIDVKNQSSMVDYVILADGNVERHVIALAKEVEKKMRDVGQKPAHIEGLQNGDWVVLDYFELVVHLLTPKMREKYQLERLWPDGKFVEQRLSEKEAMH